MNSSFVGLLGVVMVVIMGEGVGLFLRRPLGFMLRAEKSAERSDFWSAYARVVLLLVPAFFALVSFPGDATVNPVQGLIGELRWGLAGLLISLAAAAKILLIPSQAKPRNAPYVPPPPDPPVSGPAR